MFQKTQQTARVTYDLLITTIMVVATFIVSERAFAGVEEAG